MYNIQMHVAREKRAWSCGDGMVTYLECEWFRVTRSQTQTISTTLLRRLSVDAAAQTQPLCAIVSQGELVHYVAPPYIVCTMIKYIPK